MELESLLNDKSKKSKEKTEAISQSLLNGTLSIPVLLAFAKNAKPPAKATCIEALEYATRKNPASADETVLAFVTDTLTEKAPRILWESAKVIGNMAHRFPTKLNKAMVNLLNNTEHEGTVVRWATAYALGEIVQLDTRHKQDLLTAMEALVLREENNGVRKKYTEALKKVKNKTS